MSSHFRSVCQDELTDTCSRNVGNLKGMRMLGSFNKSAVFLRLSMFFDDPRLGRVSDFHVSEAQTSKFVWTVKAPWQSCQFANTPVRQCLELVLLSQGLKASLGLLSERRASHQRCHFLCLSLFHDCHFSDLKCLFRNDHGGCVFWGRAEALV